MRRVVAVFRVFVSNRKPTNRPFAVLERRILNEEYLPIIIVPSGCAVMISPDAIAVPVRPSSIDVDCIIEVRNINIIKARAPSVYYFCQLLCYFTGFLRILIGFFFKNYYFTRPDRSTGPGAYIAFIVSRDR